MQKINTQKTMLTLLVAIISLSLSIASHAEPPAKPAPGKSKPSPKRDNPKFKPPKLQEVFNNLDTDNNNKISLSEYKNAELEKLKQRAAATGREIPPEILEKRTERMGEIFKRLDTNQNGSISLGELKSIRKKGPKPSAVPPTSQLEEKPTNAVQKTATEKK